MVESGDRSGGSVAPFLRKCYDMVEDSSTDPIISWGANAGTFVIWDITDFTVQLLPKYFKHSNFSSFMRQLNIYGFRKVDTDRWEFANEGFVKGQKHLMKNIARRKNIQAVEQKKSSRQTKDQKESVAIAENDGLWKEVETLKNDKNSLMQELVKLSKLQTTSEGKVVVLKERIQGMEKNQQELFSFLVMAIQNPGLLVQLLKHGVKNGSLVSDGNLVKYLPGLEEGTEPECLPDMEFSKFPKPGDSLEDSPDVVLNNDFLKLLMEGKLSFDSHCPFVLPEFPDSSCAWDQLLLESPFMTNTEETNRNPEEFLGDSGFLLEPMVLKPVSESSPEFEDLVRQMGKSYPFDNHSDADGDDSDGSSMDFVTEQMQPFSSAN
ncbi:hypothetical protein MLD38_017537 [Melastoma candidum]|uniref:Uncharacterized protein n=1 Tax=Melastoma candidum TaxID=119954 RepID=A0ACB9QQ47_9MYRT|nr:hypothetical protein MLD38_017537 [Melastoma candidum]